MVFLVLKVLVFGRKRDKRKIVRGSLVIMLFVILFLLCDIYVIYYMIKREFNFYYFELLNVICDNIKILLN